MEYRKNDTKAGAVPSGTKIRASTSTEVGKTDELIQHVFIDAGDGTSVQPVSATDLDIRDLTATDVVTAQQSANDLVTGTRASGSGVGDVINVDCTNYRGCSVQVTGTWAGTLTFSVSNNNSTWVNVPGLTFTTLAASLPVQTTTANGMWWFMLPAVQYFRVRWTTATSGTVVVTAYFSEQPIAPVASAAFIGGIIPGTGASSLGKQVDGAAGATDTGVVSLVKRVTTPAAITPALNDYTVLQVDDNGRLWVTPAESTTPTLYNITLTLADTEYSQALPAGTRSIRFMARTAAAVRFAFVTGKVATPTAPYMTLPASSGYAQEHIYTGATLYFASASAGTVVELEVWS